MTREDLELGLKLKIDIEKPEAILKLRNTANKDLFIDAARLIGNDFFKLVEKKKNELIKELENL